MVNNLTASERQQVEEILNRRANEIAMFSQEYQRGGNHHGSVELALAREIERLRRLADKINPPSLDEEDS